MNRILVYCLIFYCNTSIIYGQDPSFLPFEGNVYSIPKLELKKGHGPHVYDNEVISTIVLEDLEIPSQNDKTPFPGVSVKDKFGMVLYSTVTIPKDGCYSFVLGSDDGSKLWINDSLFINNDRPHKMKFVTDSIGIKQGRYPIKLWYYNAYIPRYGLILKSKYVSDNINCAEASIETGSIVNQSIILQSDVLFGIEEYTLKGKDIATLDSITTLINSGRYSKIRISGHTDDTGPNVYNLKLSMLRAVSVREYLEEKCELHKLETLVYGLGKSEPLSENNSKEGRSENRRVEILLEQ